MKKDSRLFFIVTVLEIVIIVCCIFQIGEKRPQEEKEAAVLADAGVYTAAQETSEQQSETEKETEKKTESETLYQGIDIKGEGEEPQVRIRLTTSDYSSEYHTSLVLSCEQTFQLETANKAQIFTGGQTVTVTREHPFFKEGSIRVSTEGGILQIDSIAHRNQVNTYPGVLDLYLTEYGIIIVNELPLEEYVKRVVPSEMPASYGAEAARLQSVCARTYAYQKLVTAQIDTYGAIANDSTDYQVYNASLPKEVSSQATEETRGIVMMYGDEVLIPYYFSTSCGFNTDNTVWSGNALPYLRAQNLSYSGELDLYSEEVFRSFILNWDYPAYEDDCTWYRWNYTITLDELKPVLTERMQGLMAERPDSFRAVASDGSKTSPDAAAFQNLQKIFVTKRLKGGMAGEVAFVCESMTIYVTREMILRRLLGCPERLYSNQSSEGQGESEGNYLPSAFFCLVESTDAEGKLCYSICGGGNGHGIGLSQNAAHAMLQAGLTWGEVLQFFYLGTSLVQVY